MESTEHRTQLARGAIGLREVVFQSITHYGAGSGHCLLDPIRDRLRRRGDATGGDLRAHRVVYYARYRRDEFNWILHGLFPILGIGVLVPAFLFGAGIPSFKFVSRLPYPLSLAGPVVGIWMVIGIVYLIVLMSRSRPRVFDTAKVFLEEEPEALPPEPGPGREGA